MEEEPLYQQIAESVRREILSGILEPGDRLLSVRRTAEVWECTPGTVQRAYAELASQGLIESHAGRGTHVKGLPPHEEGTALRRATLLHRIDGFLLETMGLGYSLAEVEAALRLGLDRWRSLEESASPGEQETLRFAGSHDPVMTLVSERFPQISGGATLQLRFTGSLGGLMRLAQGEADIAGCHLWDARQDVYNISFVRRLLPGRRVALVTLAHRRLGFLVPAGNPRALSQVTDLVRPDLRFVNRQRGAGTRVWLEAQLHRHDLHLKEIEGHKQEALTHSAVARLIAEGEADVGVGVKAVARAFRLDFVPLTCERYELVIPNFLYHRDAVAALVSWLRSKDARELLQRVPGYETEDTGIVRWVE